MVETNGDATGAWSTGKHTGFAWGILYDLRSCGTHQVGVRPRIRTQRTPLVVSIEEPSGKPPGLGGQGCALKSCLEVLHYFRVAQEGIWET